MSPLESLPPWLRRVDQVPARVDSDRFLDRSLRAVSGTLAALRRAAASPPIPAGDAAARLGSTLLAVILVSSTRSPAFLGAYATVLAVLLATRKAGTIGLVLKGALGATGFAALVLLPSLAAGAGATAALLCAKTFCTVATVALLAAETRWESLFSALSLVRVPDLAILILDLTLRYVTVLGEYTLKLLEALKLRSVGRVRRKGRALSGIVGTLFLRSAEAARALHQAMECRCFTGSYSARRRLRFRKGTALMLGLDAVLAFLFFAGPASGRPL